MGVPNARAKGPQTSETAEIRQPARIAVRSERWLFVQCHRKRRSSGLSSNDESALARLSARSGGFDDVDGSPDCRSYIQMRGIEQVCIRRVFQGGDGPGCRVRRV